MLEWFAHAIHFGFAVHSMWDLLHLFVHIFIVRYKRIESEKNNNSDWEYRITFFCLLSLSLLCTHSVAARHANRFVSVLFLVHFRFSFWIDYEINYRIIVIPPWPTGIKLKYVLRVYHIWTKERQQICLAVAMRERIARVAMPSWKGFL